MAETPKRQTLTAPPSTESQNSDNPIDFKFEIGRTVSMVIHNGIPIMAPIPGCPPGMEPLMGEKNFYFEEVTLGFLVRDHDLRFSYNVYVNSGNRIYFIANPSRLTAISSIRNYTYVVLGNDVEEPVMTWLGDQYGGCADVCCFCCACAGRRGIRVLFKNVQIGIFYPVHRKVMPCIFSCSSCCFCYIDKYVIQYQDGDRIRQLVTRKPKRSVKRKDSGLEVIDPADRRLVARISNCVISGIKKNRVLPSELQNTRLVGNEVKVQFSLSLADPYVEMHPNGKAVLLALAMFHESEVMQSQRKVTKDAIGFLDA